MSRRPMAGDVMSATAAPCRPGLGRCVIVHNIRWVTFCLLGSMRRGHRPRPSLCFRCINRPDGHIGPCLRGQVVHINPLNLHNLSTGLSFVDNSGRGVQSRSKHNTGRVAHAQPETSCHRYTVVSSARYTCRQPPDVMRSAWGRRLAFRVRQCGARQAGVPRMLALRYP